MHMNSTHLVRGHRRTLLEKVGIWEAELREPQVQVLAPFLASLQGSSDLRTLLSVYLPHLSLTSQAIKAQFNEGVLVAVLPLLLSTCDVSKNLSACSV
jgi:hypothetical protein